MMNPNTKTLQIYLFTIFSVLLLCTLQSSISYGQKVGEDLILDVSVIDSTTLISGETKISLWGVEKVDAGNTAFHLEIRSALEKKINGKKVLCTIKNIKNPNLIEAQCMNEKEEDLSLFLLQQGYVSADRKIIYKSIYEKPYLNAEKTAQMNKKGIWKNSVAASLEEIQSKNLIIAIVIIMIVLICAFGILSFYIMRGFSQVVGIQNKSIELAAKERILKDKEKYIIASMLDAEIKSNKTKIEAYLTIYEEMLEGFRKADKILGYQKTGDIIQKQPALNRSVFDGNTSKLDLLGTNLASDIIHYYARIKTIPDYVEIDSNTSKEEAIQIIESAIGNAKKLSNISDKLLLSFVQQALVKNLE